MQKQEWFRFQVYIAALYLAQYGRPTSSCTWYGFTPQIVESTAKPDWVTEEMLRRHLRVGAWLAAWRKQLARGKLQDWKLRVLEERLGRVHERPLWTKSYSEVCCCTRTRILSTPLAAGAGRSLNHHQTIHNTVVFSLPSTPAVHV